MKRISFYTLHKIDARPVEAFQHDGYTDGTYSYYRNGSRVWFAVDPATGLAVATAETRKACAAAAHAPDRVARFETYKAHAMYARAVDTFNACVQDRRRKNLMGA